ncbi:CDP-glycerol glycerophosphotransferase family protein [Methylotuvimicrobium sp. KM2]|uniref:CDP-glycerol glycerophosphotransferase family protein n=1 Tax=Methylotuvimicrobium sp. KM2 TaxID=3133976 RepID=UPI003100ECC6
MINSLPNKRVIREVFLALRQLLTAILAWLFAYPLTCLFKRDPNLTLVIGRQGPVFADNSKYFFIAATQFAKPNERIVFLTDHRSIQQAIVEAGGKAVMHPSWRSLYLVLRCTTLAADMSDWFDYGAYPLSSGARRVQVWHGAPLKRIELDLYRERLVIMPAWAGFLLQMQKKLLGRYPKYDVVVSTSQDFTDRAFSRCFNTKEFIACGYPRNDVLLGWPEPDKVTAALLDVNVDLSALATVRKAKSQGTRIGLYVPTFRRDLANPFAEDMDLARLSAFAVRHNCFFVLKLHPFMQGRYAVDRYPNLLEYAPLGDVYPLMPLCDFLITDYSSIFFDFLLLDKAIVFFAPDLAHYLAQDRKMYFDYDEMTPGAKCACYEELEQQLRLIVDHAGEDGFARRRAEVRAFTHDFVDNRAGWRLYHALASKKN